MRLGFVRAIFLPVVLSACASAGPRGPATGHLAAESLAAMPAGEIPVPVQQTFALPRPKPSARTETYSVSVNNVPVHDLLFALARDARLNVDIHPGISGSVSLNAIDQTLPQLLSRIGRQADVRFELDGPNLAVMPDTPFLRHYRVDYVNMSRDTAAVSSVSSQIAAASPAGGPGGAKGGVTNTSSTLIENNSKHRFWENLEKNIKDLLRETDKLLPEGSRERTIEGGRTEKLSANALTAGSTLPTDRRQSEESSRRIEKEVTFREAASVIVHPETGIVTVRASRRQHDRIQEFVDSVVNAARRQVMIEATIVEVQLGDGYEQGIDWTRLIGAGKFSLVAASTGTSIAPSITPFKMTYEGKTVNAAIRLLESFGTAKVLSSPRLSVLNNQTALLKVVENIVYFVVAANVSQQQTSSLTTVSTTPQSVSVGLVMSVTAQISESDAVILNVRPTISSISSYKRDPNPNIPATIENLVPQIRTREIESIMRVGSGDIAVLGGLMEDGIDHKTGRIPGLGQVPMVGELVTARSASSRKSELIVFLRPVVIKEASLAGDYAGLRSLLPNGQFLSPPPANP
jgi:MSHA type pilus biogenesis protein MshL